MYCFQRFCILSHLRLEIVTIIIVVSINAIDAEHILGVSDAIETKANESDIASTATTTSKPIHYEFHEKTPTNSTQWSVSRPSNILKQLWSSASKSINNSTNSIGFRLRDLNENKTNSMKNVLFGPIKWSSEIVPSVPLDLQLSNDAIFLPHYFVNSVASKSSPDGEITVINGRVSSTVTYPQWRHQNQRKDNLIPKFEKLQADESSFTPTISDIYLIENHENSTEILKTLESLTSTPYPIDNSNDTTTINSTELAENATELTSLGLTATIPTTNEPNLTRKASFDLENITSTSQTILNTTEKQSPNSREARREALKLKFGMRVLPPKASIDNFLSVYKPSNIRNNVWNKGHRYKQNSTTSAPKIYSANSFSTITNSLTSTKEKLSNNSRNKLNEKIGSAVKPTEITRNAVESRYLPSENRNMLSSILLFPSRPTPILKPKLFSNPTNCSQNTWNKNYFRNTLLSKRRNFLNNLSNSSHANTSGYSSFDRRIDNQKKSPANSLSFHILDRRRDQIRINRNKKHVKRNRNRNVAKANKNTRNRKSELDLSLGDERLAQYSLQEAPYEELHESLDGVPLEPALIYEGNDNIEPTGEHTSPDQLPIDDFAKDEKEEYHDKYKKIPNPDLFKEELEKPKEKPKFTIKPVDPDYFKKKKQYKDSATLPNRLMAMQELIGALSVVRKSIQKLNPIGKKMSNAYKSFTAKVRHGIMSKKGPYANFYPPGYYDEIYEPDEVEEKHRMDEMSASEINETIVEPPSNYTYIDSIDDVNASDNSSYTENDYDDDGFIKKSFGYKVTIYRTPENGEPNITEEVVNEDQSNANKTDDLLENSESNVTEVVNEDLNNDNKTNDLTISESSNESPVTTEFSITSESKPTVRIDMSESKRLKAVKHGDLKGSGKIVDYQRDKFSKERASFAKEEKNANKIKKVDTHDRRANNERALKERTIIEFFEREQILDSAYNKDKLGIDRGKHGLNDGHHSDQYASGTHNSSPLTVKHPDGTISETYNEPQARDSINNEQEHVTDPQTFDTTFPDHDRKYKHKDNAHKYKGWRERGYKIITETEFVDRGQKLDTGYKKHEKGNSEHIKEHSAKDSGRGDKRNYYKNIKQVNKNYESQYGNQNTYDKDHVHNGARLHYPIHADEPTIKSEDTEQTDGHQTDDNEQLIGSEQESEKALPKTVINNSYAPYGSRLSSLNSKNLWPSKQTSAHLSDHQIYAKPNDNNFDNENYENTDHKSIDDKINNLKETQNADQDSYTAINPYFQFDSQQAANSNHDHPIDSYYYPLTTQQYYSDLDQNTRNPKNNNNQTEVNEYTVDNNYSNEGNNDPINYSTVETNSNTQEHPSSSPIYASNYYISNSTYDQNPNNNYRGQQITPHYEPEVDINPTKDPSMTINPYYEYQLYPTVNNNDKNRDQRENYRPYNYRVETMPEISAKAKNERNIGINQNFHNSLIDGPFVNDVIHIQEAPNLSTDNYPKQIINPEIMATTSSDIPATPFNRIKLKPPKINNKFTKNKTQRPRPKLNFGDKLAENYHLIPASPLSLPPLIESLILNGQNFEQISTPLISPTIRYQIKVPFAVQPPTRLPLLMQTSSTPIMTTESLQLGPSDGQPVAVLHPNKPMLTITTPAILKRRPAFGMNIWNHLSPYRRLSPLRWIINSNSFRKKRGQQFRAERQSLPTKLKFNLKPKINQKTNSTDNHYKNKLLFRNLFKLEKR